jgi:transposase
MYLDFLVEVPDVPGKITMKKRGKTTHVDYEYDREYLPERKYTIPRRVAIGKLAEEGSNMMRPNANFLMYFPDAQIPEEKNESNRSSVLRAGSYIVIKKLVQELKLEEMLLNYFSEKDAGLILDFCAYSIITENNAGQYYPDYAYAHPLFTEAMKIYSDAKLSDFFSSVTDNQIVGFLNDWNETKDHSERIYISYDSTNKKCQAGDIEMVENGHNKDGIISPVFNYSIAYDTSNSTPLFYEEYPGSIVDVSQLQFMIEKAVGYGYKKMGFILDRGYFSKDNIRYMDKHEYDFVIMLKGMADLVSKLVSETKGSFENKRDKSIREYKVYGTTTKCPLYEGDEKDRYFHIYHSTEREYIQRENLEVSIDRMKKYLKKQEGKPYVMSDSVKKYFEPIVSKDDVFLFAKENESVIERELDLCGYFVIVTSGKMTAKEAITLYKSRDVSEKLFRGDKSYLGNKSMRVSSQESISAKVFIEFIALILRSKIYTYLKEEVVRADKKSNYMTVPAAIRELEKIEMLKLPDKKYRLDHAVTSTQKAILKAFKIDEAYIKRKTKEISEKLHT